MAFLSRTL